MIKKIEKIFSEVTGLTEIEFTEKTRLDKIPELSSLGIVQFVCELEDEFDISVPNSKLKKFKTVGDVIAFIEENME